MKIFTMVKNEVDIIEYWIKYHGSLCGYDNLHIIDNYSDDGTYEIILKYKTKGIHIYREADYKRKGDLITNLIKIQKVNKYTFAIPLDIDEFMVFFNKTTNTLSPELTRNYINSLMAESTDAIFKMNYILSTINSQDDFGYNNSVLECEYGRYDDYKDMAKTFFNVRKWDDILDHGNHYNCNQYFLTDIVLIHYHCRNFEQMIKKVTSNVTGLGHPLNKIVLSDVLASNPNADGGHHIKHMINILDNKFKICTRLSDKDKKKSICLKPIINYILNLT